MPCAESSPKTPPRSLRKVVQEIEEISTLPQVALRVMEIAGNPESGAADLKEAMESDSALSARVLRCVNSSAYALRTRITNLQQAIAYLGLKQIRNLAMTASVSELFKEDGTIGPYCRSHLWRHLVSVGICARMIAIRLKLTDFEDVFLAGLLHDIGIILEDQHLHDSFCEVISSLDERKTLGEIERSHLGFDHAMLGSEIAVAWGFPDAVKAAIGYHHMSVNFRGDEVDTVRCVEVANLLCTLTGVTSVGPKLVKFSPPAIAGLDLDRLDIAILAEDLERELASHANLFKI